MLKKNKAIEYADYLIYQGKNDITMLEDDEKERLTALIIESNSKYDTFEFISQTNESYDLPYMLAHYMKTRDINVGAELLEHMIKGAVNYSGNVLVDLLLERDRERRINITEHFEEGDY